MKILRSLTTLILTAACACGLAACAQSPISPSAQLTAGTPASGDKTWSSTNFEINLSYPHTWYLSADQTALAMFISPADDRTPDFREYIAVGGEANDDDLTLKEIAQNTFKGVQDVFNDIEIISTQDVKVGQYDGLLYIFGGEASNEELGPTGTYYWYQYTWLTSSASYSLTLTTTKEMSEEYFEVLNYIKDSLDLA